MPKSSGTNQGVLRLPGRARIRDNHQTRVRDRLQEIPALRGGYAVQIFESDTNKEAIRRRCGLWRVLGGARNAERAGRKSRIAGMGQANHLKNTIFRENY